jgi:hypothetical protein
VLASGPDRTPFAALLHRRPPRALLAVLLALQALVVAAGAGVLPTVQERADRLSLSARVESGTVALRGRGTDGVLRLRVESAARMPVEVRAVVVAVPGAVPQGLTPPSTPRVPPGGSAVVSVRYAVSNCAALGAGGELRLAVVRPQDGRTGDVVVPVADAVAAGCRPDVVPGVAVLGASVVAGAAELGEGGRSAAGSVTVEVVSAGAPVRLVAVSAEVPGVLFVSPSLGPDEPLLAAGDRRRVRVPFTVPFCPALRPLGRVVVTVRDDRDALRQLGFAVSADGEARVARDVDLDVVLRACSP